MQLNKSISPRCLASTLSLWLLGAWASTALAQNAPGTQVRTQGTVKVDIGKGVLVLTSTATTLPQNLGQQTAARLQSKEGQAAVQAGDAKARAATGKGFTQGDVQALADSFAGKTIYDSTITQTRYVAALNLTASTPKGPRVSITIDLNDKMAPQPSANVSFYPSRDDSFERFETGKNSPATVRIDKFEQVGANTYRVAGSFSAENLQPARMAKKLAGQSLSKISGEFSFDDVPVRKLGF